MHAVKTGELVWFYRRQLAQLRLETIENLLKVLRIIFLLGNQFKLFLLPWFNLQLQTFQLVLDTGQSRLDALRLIELDDGVNPLGAHRNISAFHQSIC